MVVYIKGEAEIEKVQKITATEIVELAKGPDGPNTLAARKDIIAIRRLQGRLIFKVATEASKKILESNNF